MRQMIMNHRKYLIFSLIFLLSANSCDKVRDSLVPDIPFSFTINLNIINELTIPGNSVYFPNVGYGGVIVYCEQPETYYAFDATCTNEISQNCKIKNEGILGTCSCCGSQFILISGAYPSKGPATAPLKQYRVSNVNSFTLRVYN
jgi:nitrite reductase/ring-hydroxylating ferredoxin subunit